MTQDQIDRIGLDAVAAALVESPSLAPFNPTTEQHRFLWLHEKHHVTCWKWIFGGSQLRAFTDKGITATIDRTSLDDMVDAGLMEYGFGCADVNITDAGRECCK